MDKCNKELNRMAVESRRIDIATLFLRLFIGAILFTQAITKSQNYMWLQQEYPDILGLGADNVVTFVGLAELVGGVLIAVGLFTRYASGVMAVVMLFAAFVFFPHKTFAQGELNFVYSGIYVFLLIAGAGRYSLDNFYAGLRANRRGR